MSKSMNADACYRGPNRRGLEDYARPIYAPVRVSILMTSPSWIKSGTFTVFPVSRTACFVTFEAVSPRSPSGDSVTFSWTEDGNSTWTAFPSA